MERIPLKFLWVLRVLACTKGVVRVESINQSILSEYLVWIFVLSFQR